MKSVNRIPFIILVASIAFSAGCSSNGTKNTEDKTAEKSASVEPAVKVSFANDTLKAVYEHYIHLKNVLVKSDGSEAQTAAAELQTALTNAGNATGAELAGKIASTKDLAAQRAEFNPLTAEVESTIKSGEITGGKIYKQYCPMANDGNGGYWLSAESEIRNPYYGDDMLECGEVKEEIQ